EWVTVDGNQATIGITDFAQSQLGDVVFMELPSTGRKLAARETFGVIESVKAASDLYAPIARRITAVNEKLSSKPELINSAAYAGFAAYAGPGTCQAIFEFQSLIADGTALDVANASLYDGATAVAEAAMMAFVQTGRNEVFVSCYVHPEYVQVLRVFGEGRG